MKSILTFDDSDLGKVRIIVPKIREIYKGLGNVVIAFDNGDKRSINTMDSEATIKEIEKAIEDFYIR